MRFSCVMQNEICQMGHNYMHPCVLIEVDKLRGCKGFENAIEYINTSEEKQRKGAGGGVK